MRIMEMKQQASKACFRIWISQGCDIAVTTLPQMNTP